MKTLFKKTIAIVLAIGFLSASFTVSAESIDSLKVSSMENELGLTSVEVDEIMQLLDEEISDDSLTYEIYDENDKLMASATFLEGTEVNDKSFNRLKAQSEMLMEIGATTIFRLQNTEE